jgi:RimJ/RimL family protein N-acetyltransferase
MVAMPKLVDPAVPAGRLSTWSQPELVVDELLLRPWTEADAPAIVEAYRDPAIQRWHARSMTHDEALSWARSWTDRWATETAAGWAVVEGAGVRGVEVEAVEVEAVEVEGAGVLLGRVDLRTLDLAEGHGEGAYWVVPRARGRNVAPRALRALTEWMFTNVGLHRIDVEHSTRNEASCRVATKAGFVLEGTKASSALHSDGWHDMHLHARLNEPNG